MFLGGDYKFLFMVMGLDGARSTHWCLIHKLDRWDTSKPIEHYQSIEMKRILAHIKSMLTQKKFSVIHQSLFNIEFDHVILDKLHLMMRVTDRLTENLITEVVERDGQADLSKGKGDKKRYLPGDSHKHYKKSWGLLFHLGKEECQWKGEWMLWLDKPHWLRQEDANGPSTIPSSGKRHPLPWNQGESYTTLVWFPWTL